ncbi:MAG: M15 family metallopeptidase [Bacteroidota bacterium]
MRKQFIFGGIVLASLFCLVSCSPNQVKEETPKTQASLSALPNTPVANTTPTMEITIDSSIRMEDLMGKIKPSQHPNFVVIARKYASRNGMYLHKAAYQAFQEMHTAAAADGISLTIKSATRPFAAQKIIWEGKWTGKRLTSDGQNLAKTTPDPKARALKILEYSSMPGTSRHHWGTDIDLNSFTNAYFEKGKGLKEYEWLVKNAPKYGFCQTYTPKGPERPHGYNEEKWHWSYLPVAQKLTEQYQLRLSDQDIKGFLGAETAVEIEVVRKYVLGINQECLKSK